MTEAAMDRAAGTRALFLPRWPVVPLRRRLLCGLIVQGCAVLALAGLAGAALPASSSASRQAPAVPSPASRAAPLVGASDEQVALACGAVRRTVHGPALTVPRARLQAGGPEEAFVFRAAYALANGSGTLTRAGLVRDADGELRLQPGWDAARLLARRPPALRHIFTLDPYGATMPFLWELLSAEQRDALERLPDDTSEAGDGLGAQRLDFLRGDRSLEGRGFRRRAGLLGDAVHGAPVFVGAGANTVAHARADAGYRAFQRRTQRRIPAVYLGTNDGMLHAFNARTGGELFAYVPNMLFGALSALTSPDYSHRAYVDGPLTAGEAQVGGDWRSVLVGSPAPARRACSHWMSPTRLPLPSAWACCGNSPITTIPPSAMCSRPWRWPAFTRAPAMACAATATSRWPAMASTTTCTTARALRPRRRCSCWRWTRRRTSPGSWAAITTASTCRHWNPACRPGCRRRRWWSMTTTRCATPMPATCRATCGASISPARRRGAPMPRYGPCSSHATAPARASRSPSNRRSSMRPTAATWCCSAPACCIRAASAIPPPSARSPCMPSTTIRATRPAATR